MLWGEGGRGVELSLRDSALHSRSVIHLSHMTPPPHGSGQGSQKKTQQGQSRSAVCQSPVFSTSH